MPFPRLAWPAALLLVLSGGAAFSQVTAPGSLPPPRPLNSPAPPQAAAPAPAAPASVQRQALPPVAQPSAVQRQPLAPAAQPSAPPRQPAASAPTRTQARPAPERTTHPATPPRPQPGQRPQPQAQRPAQAPAVGTQTAPQNRRPGAAAAAGAAAGAAAAGAAAMNRAPEPPRPSPAPHPQPPSAGPVSGLPLPRFASLRSDQVNMRVGPSTSFPIEWTFQRRDLPVQIIGEFQVWRRIRDADGAEGWVHQSTLAGRRTVLVRPPGTPETPLRRRPEDAAPAVARLRPGVIARVRECEAESSWCEVQVAGHRGYMKRSEAWGVGPEEEVK